MHLFKMRKEKTGVLSLAVLCVLACVLCSGCKDDTEVVLTTGFYKNEVFRIEGMSCYTPEVMIYLTNIQNQYAEVFGEEIFAQSIDGIPIEESIKQTVLARIAKIKMMNLMAEYYEIELSDRETELVEKAAEEYYNSLGSAEIDAMGGVTKENVLQLYREYALANKLYQYLVADVNDEISDDEARTVTVQQIFLSTTYERENGIWVNISAEEKDSLYAQAESLRARLEAGEDFASLASEYSDDEELMGYYRKKEVERAIEDAVFNLAEGELSQIVEGEKGYYIFYCVSTYDMEQTEAAKREILRERQQEAFDRIYAVFIGDKHCYLNEELWATISFADNVAGASSNFFEIYENYFLNE